MQNFITISIPKNRKLNFKMLEKVYGTAAELAGSDGHGSTYRVYLSWGIN